MNTPSNAAPDEIGCVEVKRKLDAGEDFVLLDCREADEYALMRIDPAVWLPMSEMQQRAGELEPYRDRELVVYCHHGMRSLQVCGWLRGQGFASVRSLADGIDGWARQVDGTLPRY